MSALIQQQRSDTATTTVDIGGLMARGAVAGLTAGFGFILANMWFAVANGKPAIGPFLAISTIFHGSSKPVTAPPQAVPAEVVTGLVTHVGLSLGFGIGFAVLVAVLPMMRRPIGLVIGALLYGLALYVFNFQVLGNTAFPWFTDPKGPDQVFELLIHPLIFGLLLVPFFVGWSRPGQRG